MRHFDPRYNTSSGKAGYEPYTKKDNAALVARVMLRQERPGAGVKFEFGENRAKKIDMDKAPE